MFRACLLLFLVTAGCAGKNDSPTGVLTTQDKGRNVVFLPPGGGQSPTPEEYGMQMLELAVQFKDTYVDTTQTPMDDQDFVTRAAAIIREAQATACVNGIQ